MKQVESLNDKIKSFLVNSDEQSNEELVVDIVETLEMAEKQNNQS